MTAPGRCCGATHRLGRLAQDITAVSRAEEHLPRIRPVPTTTGAPVTAAIDAVRERYDSTGVALHSRIDDSLVVIVDPDRLGQVRSNLLGNAPAPHPDRRHGHCHQQLSEQRSGGDRGGDTGERIALDHLFDRFYRADTARDRSHGGSGHRVEPSPAPSSGLTTAVSGSTATGPAAEFASPSNCRPSGSN